MVDTDVVMERVLNGLYTGAGAVLTGAVGNFIAGNVSDSNMAVAGGEILVGATVSVGADEFFPTPDAVPNEALEHAGYGMQAVGWDEFAESMNLGFGGPRVVEVNEVEESGGSSSQRSQPEVAGGY